MSENNEQFQRKQRKSLSQKRDAEEFNEENKNIKRFSQLTTNNKIIPEFDNSLEKSKLQSRSSLPIDFRLDRLSNYKGSNLDDNNNDKRSSNSKDFNSSREKISSKNASKIKPFYDSFQTGIKDIKVVWKNKGQEKEEEKEQNALDKQLENIETFFNHFNEKCKANENIEINYSSSTLGYAGSKKSISKSDDKNTKNNLKKIIDYDKIDLKKNSSIILSDINNAENKENKLDILIKTMVEYKDIIMEKMLCKNFQDRLILNIFICLSQLSFKLYNCVENKTKYENLRRYICSITDDIKYNLINNPNFTINLINQKFIDIDSLDKNLLINSDDFIIENDNNPININANDSSCNYNSRSNRNMKSNHSENSDSQSNNVKDNFFNFFEEEIIYENFEEFNNDNRDDKEIYVNPTVVYEMDAKDNNINNFEQNAGLNKQNAFENNALFSQKNPKLKARRNATHRMLISLRTAKSTNNNNTTTGQYVNKNNYNFHIIDINSKTDKKETNDDSFDDDEDCIEVTETHKFEKQKLLFFEDYVRDKEKRRITKIDSIDINPDPKFLENKERLIKLNEVSYKTIIDIIHDDASVLPNHHLNMNPIDIANFIKEGEKVQNTEKESSEVNEEEEEEDDENKSFFDSDESSIDENLTKDFKRFRNINKEMEKVNNEEEDEEKDDENVSEKTWKSKSGNNKHIKNSKILVFDNEDDFT